MAVVAPGGGTRVVEPVEVEFEVEGEAGEDAEPQPLIPMDRLTTTEFRSA